MKSYFAEYWSTDGKPLCGGVMRSVSSRFERREDAELRLATVQDINPGRCAGQIHEAPLYPEIFSHCEGRTPQALGGLCFGCGKKVTVADAKRAGAR